MIRLCAFVDEAGSSLQAQIDALRRNGIGLLEIRTVDSVNIGDMTLERAEEVAKILAENGLKVWSLGSPMGKVSLEENFDIEEYLPKVEHMCKLTKIFGADKIRMFSFFDAYDKKEQVFAYLKRMVEVADKYGVKLCHENEKKVYGDTLERVQELMENVPGLKFVYDPANYIQCGEDPKVTLPTLHSKMEYFHIKDTDAKTEELVPAGVGDGDIPKLIEMIEGDQVLTLEPHLAIFDGYATIDDEEMKNRFHFENNDEAFDYAVTALKGILTAQGYKEENGGFVK